MKVINFSVNRVSVSLPKSMVLNHSLSLSAIGLWAKLSCFEDCEVFDTLKLSKEWNYCSVEIENAVVELKKFGYLIADEDAKC